MNSRYQVIQTRPDIATSEEFRSIVLAVCRRVSRGSKLNDETVMSVLRDHGKINKEDLFSSSDWIYSVHKVILHSSFAMSKGDGGEDGIKKYIYGLPDSVCCLDRQCPVGQTVVRKNCKPIFAVISTVIGSALSIRSTRICLFICLLYMLSVFYIVLAFDPFGYSSYWIQEDYMHFFLILIPPPAVLMMGVFIWRKWVNPRQLDLTKV